MKTALWYWGVIAALGFVHLQALLTILPWDIPFYVVGFIILTALYFFYKRIIIKVDHLGLNWNFALFGMQLLLLAIIYAVPNPWIYFIPSALFIMIEFLRLKASQKLVAMQRELQVLEEQRSHINETFMIVRGERHDFLKHVSALHFMLEKHHYEEAKDYLDELVDGYEETNLSIKGERGIVAGVLHQMYRCAKASGVSVVYDFDLPLSTLPLSDTNMVTLLGNLLSNSIDACEEWQAKHQKQALLTVQFYKRAGLYLIICKNNSLPIPTHILDELYHTYGKTTKGKGHQGLGTKMIKDIVKEHQGFLDFVYKDEEFMVKIKIPAIR